MQKGEKKTFLEKPSLAKAKANQVPKKWNVMPALEINRGVISSNRVVIKRFGIDHKPIRNAQNNPNPERSYITLVSKSFLIFLWFSALSLIQLIKLHFPLELEFHNPRAMSTYQG